MKPYCIPHAYSFLVALLALPLAPVAPVIEGATILIDFGDRTEWRYLDDGSDAGQAWREPGFDDSRWTLGPAPLGYSEPELSTTVCPGDQPGAKPVTTYFRHSFELPDTRETRQVLLLLRSDDGAVVYLNGKELTRDNIAPGEVTFQTLALDDLDGAQETSYRRHLLPASSLAQGRNVVAVEGGMTPKDQPAPALGALPDEEWELLVSVLVRAERFDDLAAVCSERLQRKSTVRDRLVLAKACEKLGRPEEVRKQVDAAVALDAGDFQANLAKAMVLLKDGDSGSSLSQAAMHLRRASRAMGQQPPSEDQMIEYLVVISVYLALGDQAETAMEILEGVVARDPSFQAARSLLEAIDR